jgi:hypothetical protein
MKNSKGTGRFPTDRVNNLKGVKFRTGIGKDAFNWFHADMKPGSWRKWMPGNGKLGIHCFGQEKTDRINCEKRASWVEG